MTGFRMIWAVNTHVKGLLNGPEAPETINIYLNYLIVVAFDHGSF